MKTFVKFAAVGLAGYLIGFYEMKYKVVKAVAEDLLEKRSEETTKKDEEEL